MSGPDPQPVRYLPLLEALDAWHAAARAEHPGVIPCQRGCAACCLGPFDISVADAATLLEGIEELDQAQRDGIIARARDQMAAVAAIEPRWVAPYEIGAIGEARFDRISETLREQPCPCLGAAGECLVYHHRPMVCRLIGLSLTVEPAGDEARVDDVIDNACPIQHQFPAYASLPARPFPLEAWERDEEVAKEVAARVRFAAAVGIDYETTIAGAVMAWLAP